VFVSFRNAKLTVVDFSGSSLSEVDFENANLDRVSFAKADIKAANFKGAELNAGVDFTEAEWWLARGWTDDQLKQLELKFPHGDYAYSDRYSSEIKTKTNSVETAKDNKKNNEKPSGQKADAADAHNELAYALNQLAWYRATHGVQLPDALVEIEQALKIKAETNYFDTKAYILMQQGNFVEAKGILAQALGADPTNPPPDLRNRSSLLSEILYRYALSLDIVGEAGAAKVIYSMTSYRPTHERLLVSRPANPKQQ
jgi:tetratricopeptide (TPR) repeat protein